MCRRSTIFFESSERVRKCNNTTLYLLETLDLIFYIDEDSGSIVC